MKIKTGVIYFSAHPTLKNPGFNGSVKCHNHHPRNSLQQGKDSASHHHARALGFGSNVGAQDKYSHTGSEISYTGVRHLYMYKAVSTQGVAPL